MSLDFFANIGNLSIERLNRCWLTDGNRKRSARAAEIFTDGDDFRKRYWAKLREIITAKTSDWHHENEYRLTLNSSLTDFSAPMDRTVKYNFESLDGIVFGIKTKMADKVKIMETIDKKCAEHARTDFNFYQAFYSAEKRTIEHAHLGLVKVSLPSVVAVPGAAQGQS